MGQCPILLEQDDVSSAKYFFVSLLYDDKSLSTLKFFKDNLYLFGFKTKDGTWFAFSDKMKGFDRPKNLGYSNS